MSVQVSLDCPELAPSDLQALADELAGDLNAVAGLEAGRVELAAVKGARGELISIGNIVLTFISSGAAVAAINVLKTYFDRQSQLKFKIQGNDGEVITLDAKNLKSEHVGQALEVMRKSVGKRK